MSSLLALTVQDIFTEQVARYWLLLFPFGRQSNRRTQLLHPFNLHILVMVSLFLSSSSDTIEAYALSLFGGRHLLEHFESGQQIHLQECKTHSSAHLLPYLNRYHRVEGRPLIS